MQHPAGYLESSQYADTSQVRDRPYSTIKRIKYPLPPRSSGISGKRGSAFSSRAAGYRAFDGLAHTQSSSEGIVQVVTIKTIEGVDKAAVIAAVPGVGAVFIAPNDLAHNMGCENCWNEAPVQAAIELTLKAVAEAGKCPGILVLTPEDEDRQAAWGARATLPPSAPASSPRR